MFVCTNTPGPKIHDRVDAVLLAQPVDQLLVADVSAHQHVARRIHGAGQVLGVTGVGEQVQIDDFSRELSFTEQTADERGADEPGAAGHQQGLRCTLH
jgi:hypothetical protein